MTEFNSVVYREGMAPEVAKAAVYSAMHPNAVCFPVGKTSVIPQETLDKIPEGPILVLGSYYDGASIEALAKKGPVALFFYGKDDIAKYRVLRGIRIVYEMFTEEESKDHQWLRRTISRFRGAATPEDEAFQRGVLQQRSIEEIRSGDMFPVFARLVAGVYKEDKLIADGLAIAATYSQMAISIDATAAMDVIIAGQKARFAITASEPVMPIVEQLAKGEGKLGITMRYSFKDGKAVTMLTAFTSDSEHVDTSFVVSMWDGGGTEKCKGKTFEGFWIPTFRDMDGGGPKEFSVEQARIVKVD